MKVLEEDGSAVDPVSGLLEDPAKLRFRLKEFLRQLLSENSILQEANSWVKSRILELETEVKTENSILREVNSRLESRMHELEVEVKSLRNGSSLGHVCPGTKRTDVITGLTAENANLREAVRKMEEKLWVLTKKLDRARSDPCPVPLSVGGSEDRSVLEEGCEREKFRDALERVTLRLEQRLMEGLDSIRRSLEWNPPALPTTVETRNLNDGSIDGVGDPLPESRVTYARVAAGAAGVSFSRGSASRRGLSVDWSIGAGGAASVALKKKKVDRRQVRLGRGAARRSRTIAVSLTVVSENGVSYADAMKKCRQEIDLNNIGIEELGIRRAVTGGLLFWGRTRQLEPIGWLKNAVVC